MKAVVHERYGPPDVLHVEDVAVPSPGAGHVIASIIGLAIARRGEPQVPMDAHVDTEAEAAAA